MHTKKLFLFLLIPVWEGLQDNKKTNKKGKDRIILLTMGRRQDNCKS